MNQPRLTWRLLVKAQPKLKDLLAEARAIDGRSDPHFCANRLWYSPGGFKDRLCDLVGWTAEGGDPILKTSEAYDLAYGRVYNALPDCRDCWCLIAPGAAV